MKGVDAVLRVKEVEELHKKLKGSSSHLMALDDSEALPILRDLCAKRAPSPKAGNK